MYNFHTRLNQLFAFDKIRIFKIVEMLQYTIIYSILVILCSYLLNKYYYKPHKKISHNNNTKQAENKFIRMIQLSGIIIFELFVITILFFYIRKIGLLIPSIPELCYPNFTSHTTLEYIIHIAVVVFFIELLPGFKDRLEELNRLLLHT